MKDAITINQHQSFDNCLYGLNDEWEVWPQLKEYFLLHLLFRVLLYSYPLKIYYFLAMWKDFHFFF